MQPIPWILFTDMDGTVLDKETYLPGPAMEALERCRDASIPVVLNSSKTRAEMEFFHDMLPLLPGSPFVSENGGGVFLPRDSWEKPPGAEESGGFWMLTLGTKHELFFPVLKKIMERLKLDARLFSDLSPEEIAALTGLPLEQAGLAREREFDEPFWLHEAGPSDLTVLRDEIRSAGLKLTRGGRCYHVHGVSDKGKAVGCVADLYQKDLPETVRSAGVGDALNDLPLLEAVNRAYLVKGADGMHDPDIPEGQGIRRVQGAGPLGFCQVVDDLLGPALEPGPERGERRRDP